MEHVLPIGMGILTACKISVFCLPVAPPACHLGCQANSAKTHVDMQLANLGTCAGSDLLRAVCPFAAGISGMRRQRRREVRDRVDD